MQDISWDTATRTADANVRIAGTVRIIRDGVWEYRLNEANRSATWWARNTETAELVRTGYRVMTDVRRFMFDLHVARGGNKGLTIASGPERSRAGDQRYRKAFAA